MNRRSLAVVLPSYDEEENLRSLIPELSAVLAGIEDYDSTIYVVVRSHPDVTALNEIRELGAIPVTRGPGDSFGDAIRSGIAIVPPDIEFVIFMDADGSHPPDTIPRLLEFADSHDVVVASRYVSGGQSDYGPVLRGMSRSLNLCFRMVLGIDCKDVSTNFKLYKRAQLQAITLTCDKFDIVEEILFRLQRHVGKKAFRVHEVPDRFHERRSGTSKRQLGPFVVSYVVTLVRLRTTSGN